MKIILCIDFAMNTEEMLIASKKIVESIINPELYIIHIIDETLFYPTSGYEVPAGEEVKKETEQMDSFINRYFPNKIQFIEECGVPQLRIPELIVIIEHDLLIMGTHSRHGLEEKLLGGLAEHLLHISKKPVLIIP